MNCGASSQTFAHPCAIESRIVYDQEFGEGCIQRCASSLLHLSFFGAESLHMAVNSFVYTTASAFLRSLHYEVLIEHRVNPFKLYPVRLFHTRIESDLCRATRGGYSSPSMLSSQSLIAKWALSRVSRKLWAAMKRKVNDLFLLLYKKHVYSNNVFSLNEGLYKKKQFPLQQVYQKWQQPLKYCSSFWKFWHTKCTSWS